jgi:PAS domain S-box-containing protein
MDDDKWQFWERSRRRMGELPLLRYGLAVVLPLVAAFFIHQRKVFTEAPFFIFLAAVVLSAVKGGMGPAVLSTGISAVLMRLLFVGPGSGAFFDRELQSMEPRVVFVLLALLLSLFVAGLRHERDHLRDTEECYRLVAESASDAIFVIDERGEILYLNPAAERTFGMQAGALRGRNLSQLLPGNDYSAQLGELKRNLDTRKRPVALQLSGRRDTGEQVLVEMTLGSSCLRGRGVFPAIVRDITAPAAQA